MRMPPRPAASVDVVLRPAAQAQVWTAVGAKHEQLAVPGVALGASDVLVAVELSTICGSDVHTVSGHRSAPAPLVLGHESVGRVIAIGVEGKLAADGTPLQVGDRVVWSVTATCGQCSRCAAGLTQKCVQLRKYGHERVEPRWELSGGFASHVHLIAGSTVVRVPEGVPAAVLAPVSCATATAWAAVERAAQTRSLVGAQVRVYGAGPVGLSAVAIAAQRGAIVDVVDPSKERRHLAVRFGATEDPAPAPADIVIEASGHAVADSLAAADIGGTVVLVGSVFPAPPVMLDAEDVVRRLLTITGVHNYSADDLAHATNFLVREGHAFPFAELVGRVYPLSDLDAALRAARVPGASPRIGVDPRLSA